MAKFAARRLTLPTAEDTVALGRSLAPRLAAGDTVLLSGPIGAGKSLLARTIIQTRQAACGAVEDVPSPTFTLVQTYFAGPLEIWHADLYRLSGPDDVAELGLEEAFDTALCLVEWPDRLGDIAPADAIHIDIGALGQGRTVSVRATQDTLSRLIDPELAEQDD